MTRLFAAALFALPGLAAVPAAAQDIPGPIDVSGGVDVVSDYRFRGLSLSGGDVAVQPTITLSHDSGLYLGAWGSNIEDTPAFGEVEVDLYGGYATDVAPGTSIDLGLTYYLYPDGERAAGPSDYVEATGKLSHTLGPVEANARISYAPSQASLGHDDSVYLAAGLSAGIPTTPLTLTASAGYTDGGLAALAPGGHYWDWSLGASASFGPVIAGLKYVDTDIPATGVKAVDKIFDSGVVFSIGFFF
jgi:uncharacterized protein (TIGR02001 family)